MNEEEKRAARQAAELERARKAEELIANPMLVSTLAEIRDEYLRQWQLTENTEGREALWYALRGLEAFGTHLRATLAGGAVAQAQISKLARRA